MARSFSERAKSGVGMISKLIEKVFYGSTWKFSFFNLLHLLQSLANTRGQAILFGYGNNLKAAISTCKQQGLSSIGLNQIFSLIGSKFSG
ncbi:hypothetical protein EVA_13267 [gut metagenome]|uniref:Uncharacterized protein n=1 Tax=gut metagenome TaxID=749906 RepID=J9CF66_9ZZZZ